MDHKEIYDQLIYINAHCDSAVLHSPGKCEYCDKYPEAQQTRIDLGVRFTDDIIEDDRIPCPAIAKRSHKSVDGWGGNQPKGSGVSGAEIEYYESVERPSSKMFYGFEDPDAV